jgi:hypothetical protein
LEGFAEADIYARLVKVGKVRRLVSSPLDPCCHLHEWPVVLLRDSMKFFTHAAFLPLRAHAA